mmetsp:Transcript_39395/g.118957  ORF Transcript_39395/g.118957 Transcript_39395/m.118957 type:complete len:258 (+) Transcript_39395:564-1337(+)
MRPLPSFLLLCASYGVTAIVQLSPRYTLSLSGLRMRSCSVLLRNERVQSQQELVHGVMLGAELLDLGGSKDVWGEHHAQFQTLRLAHVAKVVLHHLLRLGQQQVAEQHLLVDAAGPDERRVELFRMVGRHDDDAVGAVHHAVEHVKQPGEVEPVLLLQQRLESVLLLGRPLLHHRHHLLHLLHRAGLRALHGLGAVRAVRLLLRLLLRLPPPARLPRQPARGEQRREPLRGPRLRRRGRSRRRHRRRLPARHRPRRG